MPSYSKAEDLSEYLVPSNGNHFVVKSNNEDEYCIMVLGGSMLTRTICDEGVPQTAVLKEEVNWFFTDAGQIVNVFGNYNDNDALAYYCLTAKSNGTVGVELCDLKGVDGEQSFKLEEDDSSENQLLVTKSSGLVFGLDGDNILAFKNINNLSSPLYIKPTTNMASEQDEVYTFEPSSMLFRSNVLPVYQYKIEIKIQGPKYLTWTNNLWAKFEGSTASSLYYDALNKRIIGSKPGEGFLCLTNTTTGNWDWAEFSACSYTGDNDLQQKFILASDNNGESIINLVGGSLNYTLFYDNSGTNSDNAYFLKKNQSTNGGANDTYVDPFILSSFADKVGECTDTYCSNLNYSDVMSDWDDNLDIFRDSIYVEQPSGIECGTNISPRTPPANNPNLDYTEVNRLYPLLPGQSRVYWFNTGQGTTILLDTYGRDPVVVDAGSVSRGNEANNAHNERQMTSDQTVDTIRAIIGTRQASVVVSHPDADHYNLLPLIFDTTAGISLPRTVYLGGRHAEYNTNAAMRLWLQAIGSSVNTVYDDIDINAAQMTMNAIARSGGQVSAVNNLPVNVMANGLGGLYLLTSDSRAASANARTITAMYELEAFQAFFMGDAFGATELNLEANFNAMGRPLQSNGIFTASHHGADTQGSNSFRLLNFLSPALSVIQSGATNYQHPRANTWLNLAGSCALAGVAMAEHQYYYFDPASQYLESPAELTRDPVFSTQENGSFIATITSATGTHVPLNGAPSVPNTSGRTLVDFVALPNGSSTEVADSAQHIQDNAGQQQSYP